MQQLNSFVQQQAARINASQPASSAPFYTQPHAVSASSMNPTQGEPKRKRVQVPSACSQCKRAHAACSNTRPCDRCVRINQADACINSHLASVRTQAATKQPEKPSQVNQVNQQAANHPLAPTSFEPPPPLLAPNGVPFNESDVSRFLFEDTHDQFPEFPEHFECIEACATPESCTSMSSSGSFTPPPQPPTSSFTPPTPSYPRSHSSHPPPTTASTTTFNPASSPPLQPPAAASFTSCTSACTSSSSTPSTTPSPSTTPFTPSCTSSTSFTPSCTHTSSPHSPSQPFSQQFVLTDEHPVPAPSIGPSPTAVAASIAAQFPQGNTVGAGPMSIDPPSDTTYSVAQDTHAQAHLMPSLGQHSLQGPPTNMMEMMVTELIQQNKKMESMMLSLNSEMKSLKEEMTNLKQAGNPMLTITKGNPSVGPATAVWAVQDGLLMEHNQKFAQLLDLIEVPKGYSMQHFFGGPCSKAASNRMQHHLDNIKSAQPVTDYAVIERKRVTGDVMRLMIVVNVVPTATPVFITTMYEL